MAPQPAIKKQEERLAVGSLYCADLPIMVLAFQDNHDAAVTIQAGETLEILGPAQDDRFLVVRVKEEQFLVFECDLKYRAKPLPGREDQSSGLHPPHLNTPLHFGNR